MFERISVDPRIHFRKPCVKGTRIKVQDVLELVNAGIGFETIATAYYPDLSIDDVPACIEYVS